MVTFVTTEQAALQAELAAFYFRDKFLSILI